MVKSIPAIVIALAISATASASSILSFTSSNTFSGTPPLGSVQVTLTDVTGGAAVTITSSLGPGESLDPTQTLFLGFNPTIDVTKLNFIGVANSPGFDTFGTFEGINNPGGGTHKADATGGNFKLLLDNFDPSTTIFTSGQFQTYFVAGVKSTDFLFPNNAGLLGAINVLESTSNGWVSATAIPEPSSIVTASIGLISLILFRRRK